MKKKILARIMIFSLFSLVFSASDLDAVITRLYSPQTELTVYIEINSNTTVKDIKQKAFNSGLIASIENASVIFAGKILQPDDKTMSYFDIDLHDMEKIHIVEGKKKIDIHIWSPKKEK